MKRKYIYPPLLFALFAVLIAYGDKLFGHISRKVETPAVPKVVYTYIPKHVHLSDYDRHFRDAANIIEYDWTLIAAIAFTESHFDSTAVSNAGACGVMQVMPNTLRGFNIPDSMHMDPRTNIMAATELLKISDMI